MAKFIVSMSRSQYLNVEIESDSMESAEEVAFKNYCEGKYDSEEWDVRLVGDEAVEIVNWVEPVHDSFR